jgi:hypothetical protein
LPIEASAIPKRMQFVRAGVRVNSRVPVHIEWEENGEARAVDGYTMDVSGKGCLVIAPQAIGVGLKLNMTNSANSKQTEAVLIWRGHEARLGWELGIELLNPPGDFWAVEF